MEYVLSKFQESLTYVNIDQKYIIFAILNNLKLVAFLIVTSWFWQLSTFFYLHSFLLWIVNFYNLQNYSLWNTVANKSLILTNIKNLSHNHCWPCFHIRVYWPLFDLYHHAGLLFFFQNCGLLFISYYN